jgi:hypothetical protein
MQANQLAKVFSLEGNHKKLCVLKIGTCIKDMYIEVVVWFKLLVPRSGFDFDSGRLILGSFQCFQCVGSAIWVPRN